MNTETKVVAQKNLMVSLSIVLVAFYGKQVAPRLKHVKTVTLPWIGNGLASFGTHLKTVTLPYLGSGLQARWTHLKTKTGPWIASGVSSVFHWLWYTARPATVWGISSAAQWVWYTAFPAIGWFFGLLVTGVKNAYLWSAPRVYNCQIGSRIRLVAALRWVAKKIDPQAPVQAIILTPTKPAKAKTQAKKPLDPDH